jgi:integrase
MYYREHSRDEPFELSFFTNEKKIMELLENKAPSTRKTYLAAIVVLNGKEHVNEFIQKQMQEDSTESDRVASTQTKSEKQKNNWEDYESIKQLQTTYETEALKILNSKTKTLHDHEQEILNKYMMLTLSSGVYFPPRRSEMVFIKVKDPDTKTDNYIDMKTDEMIYNKYKTAKTYGTQRVKFPAPFKSILKKYLAKTSGQTYLLEQNGKPYTANQITRELNTVFGKKISTSMLRHIYLSSIYKDIPALNRMKQTAEEMGHDLKSALEYVKQ